MNACFKVKRNTGSIDGELLTAHLKAPMQFKRLGNGMLMKSGCLVHLNGLFSIELEFLQHWLILFLVDVCS